MPDEWDHQNPLVVRTYYDFLQSARAKKLPMRVVDLELVRRFLLLQEAKHLSGSSDECEEVFIIINDVHTLLPALCSNELHYTNIIGV